MTITTPPRYIPIPSTIVYARTVPSSLKDFFGSVYGLAWNTKYRFTPEMDVKELLDFLGLEMRTYQRYVQALERLSWLRSETHRNGCVRFLFPERFPIPDEKLTGKSLNDKNVALSQKVAYTTNLSFSLDEEEDQESLKDQILFNPSSSILDLLRAVGVKDAERATETAVQVGFSLSDVLANVAYCYDSRSKVRFPASVVPLHIQKRYYPEATYYSPEAHRRYIPAAVLERANLPKEELEDEVLEPEPESVHQAALAEENADPNYPGTGRSDPLPGGRTLEWAWMTVTEQLRVEMPRGTFADFVADTVALGYQAAENIFLVGAPSLYTAQWLEGRLTSTVKRILTGAINAPIDVRFIAPII
jgi:hypothetical protein